MDFDEKQQVKESIKSRSADAYPVRDWRFASQCNQLQMCWVQFNELLLCKKKFGESDDRCINRAKSLTSSCPLELVEKWNDAMQKPESWVGISFSENGQVVGAQKIDHSPYGPWKDAEVLAHHK